MILTEVYASLFRFEIKSIKSLATFDRLVTNTPPLSTMPVIAKVTTKTLNDMIKQSIFSIYLNIIKSHSINEALTGRFLGKVSFDFTVWRQTC